METPVKTDTKNQLSELRFRDEITEDRKRIKEAQAKYFLQVLVLGYLKGKVH